MKNLLNKPAETPPEEIKLEPVALVAEEEAKPMEIVPENGYEEADPFLPSSKAVELETVKQPEPENSVDAIESVKSEPSPAAGFLLPFFKGWRREVNLKEQEVCYIHPFGARLKNITDLSQQRELLVFLN